MKAYNLYGVNNLIYGEVNEPVLDSGWVLVKVKAAGICSSDVPRIYTKGTYHFPTIPGHEISGVIEKVADDSDQKMLGKRVAVFPLIPCKKCVQCSNGHYEMCSNYDYIGSRRDGGFAEYVAVPKWNIIFLPDNIAYEEAAMLEPVAVALHALKQANLNIVKSLAIVGTGMIGFAIAQWAKCLKISDISVIGRSLDKKDIVDELTGIKYVSQNFCDYLGEYDLVVEAVGSSSSVNTAINIVKPGGQLVLMGNPDGDIKLLQDMYWRILRKQLKISGTWNSSYDNNSKNDWSESVEAIASGNLKLMPLISHVFSQERLIEGLNIMKSHEEMYCKVMTYWNREKDVCDEG